jgi:hypothetical protein
MDASQDVWDWDWEVVMPDHRSFSTSHGSKNLDGKELLPDPWRQES